MKFLQNFIPRMVLNLNVTILAQTFKLPQNGGSHKYRVSCKGNILVLTF